MDHARLCQSCAMPLEEDLLGTEADGSPSPHYCKHCYRDGAFTGQMTMEEMLDFCLPFTARARPGVTQEEVRMDLERLFPTLLRWRS